ncbi:ABC transporter ATP-binding protein [Salinirussus salinus]|jgi:iron(III) transport system ATP-binding protein|uniref:ABC transporter ATP-binding protein n=1 Tax=Salinirussus salinus TaxID=1198300 RepID=UPI00135CEE74|nr:ABC transporter ATP-binding protein [Salinirussus salinus]
MSNEQIARRSKADRGGQTTRETPTGQPILELDGVTKEFGTETAVADLSLSVYEGELLTLLGPSGCGKTTTLRILAGLETPTSGTVTLTGERVAGPGTFVDPEQRDVGLVFQDYALFPHLTAAENVAFGLTDEDESERETRVAELLDLVGLDQYRDHRPGQLSGGQQQRIALARSLAPEPAVLLLDEPFSNLDISLREEMRQEVRRILKEAGVTAVSVTHDQEEALSISDRVAVMTDGQVEQVGEPRSVFEDPRSRFVANFLGRASFLPGRVEDDAVETPLGSVGTDRLNGPADAYDGASIEVLVRPDDLRAVPANESTADGRIVGRQYLGPNFIYAVEIDDGATLRCLHNHVESLEDGLPVSVDIVADHSLAWYPME